MVAGFLFSALPPASVYAQNTDPASGATLDNLAVVQQESGLGNQSFGYIVGNIIRVILGLLGIITIGIIIYGGFKYMTSSGSEEAVENAKKILVNGVIGLVIVLSSFGITQFVLSKLSGATGTNISGSEGQNENIGGGGGGGLSTGEGVFKVNQITPAGTQKYAALKVRVVFNAKPDPDSVTDTTFFVTGPDGVVAGVRAIDNDSITFVPSAKCAPPAETKNCFVEGAKYTVTVVGKKIGSFEAGITSISQKGLSCGDKKCTAEFVAGSGADLENPKVSNVVPPDGGKVPIDSFVDVSGLATDNDAIALGRIKVDDKLIPTALVQSLPGQPLSTATIKSNKFSTKDDKPKTQHTLTVVAEDLSGNTAEAKVSVTTLAQHCFNKIKDADEMDVDCSQIGGDCGACSNGVCVADKDCGPGLTCDVKTKKCTSSPTIYSVTPDNGAPKTFVTISGKGFGASGEVTFLGNPDDATDDAAAALACGKGWSTTQVVVSVPDKAKNGPIRIKNDAGAIDTTDNQWGVLLKEFKINDVERPGLCSVEPASGFPVTTKVTIAGTPSISQPNVDRKLLFGGYLADAEWGITGPETVTAFVPNMEAGTTQIQAVVKGLASNPVEFLVTSLLSQQKTEAPFISDVSPVSGGVTQYVTINGSGFGTIPGKVYFVPDKDGKPSDTTILADTDFPKQCPNTWTDKQVLVRAPKAMLGKYYIQLVRVGNNKPSNYVEFEINANKPGPEIACLVPNNGPTDGSLKVLFYGENYGPNGAAKSFASFIKDLIGIGTYSAAGIAQITVPKDTKTGDTRLMVAPDGSATIADTAFCTKNPAQCSNPLKFTANDCRKNKNVCETGQLCCPDGSCGKTCLEPPAPAKAAFAWCFSTGEGCAAQKPPTVVEECSTTANSLVIPSPSPANFWPTTAKDLACTNSMVIIKFSEAVDPKSVTYTKGADSSLLIEECNGEADNVCGKVSADVVELKDVMVGDDVDGNKHGGIIAMLKTVKPNTTYRVSLSYGIVSADSGLSIQPTPNSKSTCNIGGKIAYCFTFTTTVAAKICEIDSVSVSPPDYKTDYLGPVFDPLLPDQTLKLWLPIPFPKDHCQVLDPNSYSWRWHPAKEPNAVTDEPGVVMGEALKPDSVKTGYLAKQQTPPAAPLEIKVTEKISQKFGTGKLTINPGPPLVYEECTVKGVKSPVPSTRNVGGKDVCINAAVAVEINQQVKLEPSYYQLFECTGKESGKECDTTVGEPVKSSVEEVEKDVTHWQYLLTPDVLKSNTWYLVEISAATKGLGAAALPMGEKKSCRKGIGYCFTFKTRTSADACAVVSVDVLPSYWFATAYGLQKKQDLKTEVWSTQEWKAEPIGEDACVILKDTYSWDWGIDTSHNTFAAIDPDGTYNNAGATQSVAAYKETTEDGGLIKILATAQKVTGSGDMKVLFPFPNIESFEPSACNAESVCQNSELSTTFTVPMTAESLNDKLFVYACPEGNSQDDDICPVTATKLAEILAKKDLIVNPQLSLITKDGLVMAYHSLQFLTDKTGIKIVSAADTKNNKKFLFNYHFQKNTTYRVFLKGGALSDAGKAFVSYNYPADKSTVFSWAFKTGNGACPVNTIVVKPVDPIAKATGEEVEFAATPMSAPNACYPKGAPLKDEYTWGWSSANSSVANFQTVVDVSRQTFTMLGNGEVKDFYQTATIKASAAGKIGTSDWKLYCGSPPAKCPVGTYAGVDNCCHAPPKILFRYPKSNDIGVCRNTMVTLDINDHVDSKTVTEKSVRLGYETKGDPCNGTLVDGYCFGTVPYTLAVANTSQKSGVRLGHISLNLEKMLAANTKIKISFSEKIAPNTAPSGAAVKSISGVPVQADDWVFTTSKNPCEISLVANWPDNVVFTKLTDTNDVVAEAKSKQGGGYVPVSSIPNEYSWSWSWLAPKKKIVKIASSANIDKVTVVPGGNNGEATVTVQALITADKYFTPETTGKVFSGYTSVVAALCEVPWTPTGSIPFNVKPPYTTSDHNLSFWYCRSEEKGVLLPDLVPVATTLSDIAPPGTPAAGYSQFITLDALTLQDPVSGAAIGLRIEKNLKHLTPREWFFTKGFKGELTDVLVDGYEGVRSGNTVYVGFGNQTASGDLYSNILVMSVSEPATAEMVTIFNQLLDRITFLSSFTDAGLCVVGGKSTQTACDSRMDCVTQLKNTGAFCDNNRSAFRRDLARVTHASALSRALEKIKAATGQYPVMAAGTFVPGLVSSKWPSWDMLMQQLGMKTVDDPINEYIDCGQSCSNDITKSCAKDSDCGAAATCVTYDANTCWSAQSKLYRCSFGSSVYHYQSLNNGDKYKLWFEFEQSVSKWNDPVMSLTSSVDAFFCAQNKPISPSNICGDGLKGVHEDCDPPGSKVTASENTCAYGEAVKTCSKSCLYEPVFQCVDKCGDGVVQPVETCDEGTKYNGLYNHCPADCGVTSKKTIGALGSCGDGVVQKNEVCDIASPNGKYYFYLKYSGHAYGVRCEAGKYTGDLAQVQYNSGGGVDVLGSKTDLTIFNDKINRMCNGDEKDYKVCAINSQFTCLVDADCPEGACVSAYGSSYASTKPLSCNWDCKATGPYCGDGVVQKEGGEQCDGNVYDKTADGKTCIKTCTSSCQWAQTTAVANSEPVPVCNVVQTVAGAPTIPPGCGDNKIDASSGEECDSGNSCDTTPKDASGNYTKPCSTGGINGVACTAIYGPNNSCQYCTTTCKRAFVSGGYCGDGKRNGPELCDKNDTIALCAGKGDYNDWACGATCNIYTKKTAVCFSCAQKTADNMNKVPLNETTTVTKTTEIELYDWTIGWLPGNTFVYDIAHNGKMLYPASQLMVSLKGTKLVDGMRKKIMDIPLALGRLYGDNQYACFADDKKYSWLYLNNRYTDVKISTGDLVVPPGLNTFIMPVGSAFTYSKTVSPIVVAKEDDLNQKIKISPLGQVGDFRIVVEGLEKPNTVVSPYLDIYPQDKDPDGVRFTPGTLIMPAQTAGGSGYNLTDVDNYGPLPNGCTGGAWSNTEKSITFQNKDIKLDQIAWGAGCLVAPPFVEMDWARAWTPDNQGQGIEKNGRMVLTIRRAVINGKIDPAYYPAVYQFKVHNFWNKKSLKESGLKISLYYRNDAQWEKIAVATPNDSGAVIEDETFDSTFNSWDGWWYPFYLKPAIKQSIFRDAKSYYGEINTDNFGLFIGKDGATKAAPLPLIAPAQREKG